MPQPPGLGASPAPDVAPLTGGMPTDAQAARAFRRYRDAYLAYFDGDDVAKARALLDQARQLAPDQPLVHVHLLGCVHTPPLRHSGSQTGIVHISPMKP